MSDIVLTDDDLRIILRKDWMSIADGIMLLTRCNIYASELTKKQRKWIDDSRGEILSSIRNGALLSSDEEKLSALNFRKEKADFIGDNSDWFGRLIQRQVFTDEELSDPGVCFDSYFTINKNGFIAWCRTLGLKLDFLKLLDEDSADHVVDMLVPPALDAPAALPQAKDTTKARNTRLQKAAERIAKEMKERGEIPAKKAVASRLSKTPEGEGVISETIGRNIRKTW